MTESNEEKNEHKVTIGFKCSPSLRSKLCNQADKLGITLSSHLETIVHTQEHNLIEIENLTEEITMLLELIAFYETPFLKELFDKNKGKVIPFIDREGKKMELMIDKIADVFTVISNSFKIQK